MAEVSGGAMKVTAPITPNLPPKPEGATVTIVTTAPGTFGSGGIVPVGTEATIAVSAYSRSWMRPSTQKDAEVLSRGQ